MKDVLICCTNAEGSQLEWVAKALFDSGWSVSFMHKGSTGVSRAQCVIAVWSPRSVGDAWLLARAKTAAKRGRLISIRLGGARPPRGLRSEQVIDLSEWPARGADRAINTLLGTVETVASGSAQRGAGDDGFRAWQAAAVIALLLGGGYALLQLAPEPSASGEADALGESYQASAHAADAAAAAQHAMQQAEQTRAQMAADAEGEPVTDSNAAALRPAAVSSDAARIGAQSLATLTAAIAGGDAALDDIRGSAEEAVALDPLQPQARAVLAVLRGLVDLQWSDAQRYLGDLDSAASDADLAAVVGAFRRLLGDAAVGASVTDSDDPLCAIGDDAAFARAVVALDGAQRLTLLRRDCVVARIGGSAGVRRDLGMTR